MSRRSTDSLSQNYIGHSRSLSEGRSTSAVDFLVRNGLGHEDISQTYLRKVIQDPKGSVQNANLRQYVGEVLDDLLSIVLDDPTMWNRLRTVVAQRKPPSISRLREDISGPGLRSLVEKAEKSGLHLDVILEVYSRGRAIGTEEEAFSRVNSFIAGGKARRLDGDLLGEEVKPVTTERQLSVVKRVLSTRK